MGITSETRVRIKNTYEMARRMANEAKAIESKAMNEMLSICRKENKPMSAREISAKMSDELRLSAYEIAGNLNAMDDHYICCHGGRPSRSRFENKKRKVKTPKSCNEKVEQGYKNIKGVVRLLDDNGNEIKGSEKVITIGTIVTYQIIKK